MTGPDLAPGAGLAPLLDRRLIIVTGKGGTGKTSVAAAIGLAAAARGRRVVVIETGRDENVPRALTPAGEPVPRVGYAGQELRPGLRSLRVEPYEALAEYLRLQLGVPRMVGRVLGTRGFRQLLDAAPGWRELITLGKVWHLREARDDAGRPAHDLLIVDAPATGHGLTFLDVPRVVVSAVRAGPLRRHAGWVEGMVKDERETLLLPVALAEELPARETAELVARVRDEIGLPVDRVVVNAVSGPPFPAALPDLDRRLLDLPAEAAAELRAAGVPSPAVLGTCAAHLRARYELHRTYVERIGEWTGLPTICLPWLPAGVRGPDDLAVLAAAGLVEPA